MARRLIMIGVSGCGKSEIGRRLAQHLDCRFVEGDDLHAPASVAKMAAGTPLDDADRHDWLLRLQAIIAEAAAAGEPLVVSCSALKRRYREMLRLGDAALVCIHLQVSRELLEARMLARLQAGGHFMPVTLLDSQLRAFEALAPDERGFCMAVGSADPPQAVVDAVLHRLESEE